MARFVTVVKIGLFAILSYYLFLLYNHIWNFTFYVDLIQHFRHSSTFINYSYMITPATGFVIILEISSMLLMAWFGTLRKKAKIVGITGLIVGTLFLNMFVVLTLRNKLIEIDQFFMLHINIIPYALSSIISSLVHLLCYLILYCQLALWRR